VDPIVLGLLGSWILSQIVTEIWLSKAKPPKETTKKYSRAVLLQSVTPFMEKWKDKIDLSDIESFEHYRRKVLLRFVLSATLFSLIYIYLYLKYIYFKVS
jgi:hypothetical protein